MTNRLPVRRVTFSDENDAALDGEIVSTSGIHFPTLHPTYDGGADLRRYEADMGWLVKIGGKIAELYSAHARVEAIRQDYAVVVGKRATIPDRIAMEVMKVKAERQKLAEELWDAQREREIKREAVLRVAQLDAIEHQKKLLEAKREREELLAPDPVADDLRALDSAQRIAAARNKLKQTALDGAKLDRDRRAIDSELENAGLPPAFDPRRDPTEQMRRATAASEGKGHNRQYAEARMLSILASVAYDPRKLSPAQIEELEAIQQELYEANAQVDRDALDDALRGRHGGRR